MPGRDLPQDHFCPWREEAEELRAEATQLRTELDAAVGRLAALERHVFGKKSEKMPSLAREPAIRCSRRPARNAPTIGPTVREYGNSSVLFVTLLMCRT